MPKSKKSYPSAQLQHFFNEAASKGPVNTVAMVNGQPDDKRAQNLKEYLRQWGRNWKDMAKKA